MGASRGRVFFGPSREREHGEHGGSHEGTERRKRKPLLRPCQQRIHPLRSRRVRYRRRPSLGVRHGSPGPSAAQAFERSLAPISSAPTGATQRHLRFARVRSLTLAARGRSSSGIARRAFGAQGSCPAHRAHRRATLLPATAPRSDAEPARHFPARRREHGRQAARSADEPIPRRRSPRPCPAAVSAEDSPPSRTTARRCRPGACAPALHPRSSLAATVRR